MGTDTDGQPKANYLDMQAEIGITKHIGGVEATDELLSLCHIGEAREVLNVGCGIGVAPSYVARKYGCRVIGADVSERMIAWSRRRIRRDRVEDRVELRTADVLALPFEDDRFDIVFVESTLVFVEDKARAISECVRVTKPGGWVGLNECFWKAQPTPEVLALTAKAVGPCVPLLETWQELWEKSGLRERRIATHDIEARDEIMSRIRWIGWRWLVPAWGRALRLYLTKPVIRQAIKDAFDIPPGIWFELGYGLFVGRK